MNKISFACISFIFLAGCLSNPSDNTDVTKGTASGAILGAVIGNITSGNSNKARNTLIGALAGGVLGNQVGKKMAARRAEYAQTYTGLNDAIAHEQVNIETLENATIGIQQAIQDNQQLITKFETQQNLTETEMTAAKSLLASIKDDISYNTQLNQKASVSVERLSQLMSTTQQEQPSPELLKAHQEKLASLQSRHQQLLTAISTLNKNSSALIAAESKMNNVLLKNTSS